ncbi:MAG: choice-of-anchor D domain-containing protein [Candidatus Sulfotelmatobacter sp.]
MPLSAQTVNSFEGIDAVHVGAPELDVDPNGAVGTKQYMEWVNVYFQAYDKTTFAPVWSSAQKGTSPWQNNGITTCNTVSGDGVVIFDHMASRWVIAARTPSRNNYNYCVAVSNTDDLTSTSLKWYTYVFSLNSVLGTNAQGDVYFPDWPKIAAWPDAYYVSFDLNDPDLSDREVGFVACAFDRTNMLVNGTANTPICFREPNPVTTTLYLAHSLIPAGVDGTTPPPAGRDEYLVSIQNPPNDGKTVTSSVFNLWDFHVDWAIPANSTFTQSSVSVAPYTPGCYTAGAPANTVCVPEPSTATTRNSIDSVGDRFMPGFDYRNFGSYESFLVSHAVLTGSGANKQTGVRWYELRGSGTPALFQDGTVSPDSTLYRFMPSIAEDSAGNAAVGYSTSSSGTHPSISASYFSLTNPAPPTEIPLFTGTGDEENSYHWGDYTSMTVDPVDGCTFWYVNEYFPTNQTGSQIIWNTRIANFKLPSCGSVTLAPSSLTFASQTVGTTSPAQNVTLTNNQSVALGISGISFTGANNTDFAQTNTCGSSVGVGGTCTISVTFTPSAAGTRTATLNVNDDGPNSPQTVSLTGTGASSATLTVSPGSINFGNQVTGTTSGISAVQITNNGSGAVNFSAIAVTGTNSSDFAQSNNCQPSLPGLQGCTVNVTFTPSATGSRSASLTLTDDASNSPQTVGLSGLGVAPVTLSATSLNFGAVLINSTSTAPTITLTNNQSIALSNISISVIGSAAFTQVNTCGSGIPARGHCNITVTFAPTVAGLQTATVNVADSAGNSPQTISLKGTGVLAVAMNPASLSFATQKVGTTSPAKKITVTNNQKVTLTFTGIAITGTNSGDFAQANTCSSLPAGGKCTVTVTFTPSAKGQRSATLTLTDSAVTSPQTAPLTGTGN